MNAEDTAFWLRVEHEKVWEVASSLEEKIAIVPRIAEQWFINEVREAFDTFRTHMTKHQGLEETDGYMLPVVKRQPALSIEIERLAHEHGEIQKIMDLIREELNELSPKDPLLIRDSCHRIHDLLLYIEHHEKDENLLVTSTFGHTES